MKCIILVAGYATRLYPLTIHKPKALLPLGSVTILDHVLHNIIESYDGIDEYIIMTNDKFYPDFMNWKLNSNYSQNIEVISDNSTSTENSLGAVNSLIEAIRKLRLDNDVFVLAGDNVLDFSLDYIFKEFIEKDNSCTMYYEEFSIEKIRKTGVIELDSNDDIVSMEEKPFYPKTSHAIPPFYWLKRRDVTKILKIFENGTKQAKNIGEIIFYLCKETKIHAILMKGNRYNVDTIDEYNELSKKLIKKIREDT